MYGRTQATLMDSLKCSYGLDSEESNLTDLASCNSTGTKDSDYVTRDVHWMVILLSCIITQCGAFLGAFANIKALRAIWRKWYVRKSCVLTIQLLIASSITCCVIAPMDGISKALRFFEKPSMLSCSFIQLLMLVTKFSSYVCVVLIAFERQHKIRLGTKSVSELSKRWLSLSFGWCFFIPLFLYQAVMEYQHYPSSSVFYQLCVSQRIVTLNMDVLDLVTVMYILEPIIYMMTLTTSAICYARGMVILRRQMPDRKRSRRSVVYRDVTRQSKSPTTTIPVTPDDLDTIKIGLNSNIVLQSQKKSIKDQIVIKLNRSSKTSKLMRGKESVSSNIYQSKESKTDKKKESNVKENYGSPVNIPEPQARKPRKPTKARIAELRRRRNKIQGLQSETETYNSDQSVIGLFTINPISEQPQESLQQDEKRSSILKPFPHVNKKLGKGRQNEANWHCVNDQFLRTWSMSSNKTTASDQSIHSSIKGHDSIFHKLNWPAQSMNHVAPLRSFSTLSSTTFNSVTTEDMIQCDGSVIPMAMNRPPWDPLYSNSGNYDQQESRSASACNGNFWEANQWYPQNYCPKTISDLEYQSQCTEKNHMSSTAIKTWQLNDKYIRNKENAEMEDCYPYRQFSFSSFSNSDSEQLPRMLHRHHHETTKKADDRLPCDELNKKYKFLWNTEDLKPLNIYLSPNLSVKHRRIRSLEDFRRISAMDDDPMDFSRRQNNVMKETADASTQMDEVFFISSSQPHDRMDLQNYHDEKTSCPRIMVTQPGLPDQCKKLNNCRQSLPRNVLHNNWCSGFQEISDNDQTPDVTAFRSIPNSCINIQPPVTWRALPQLQRKKKKEVPFNVRMICRSLLILGVLMISFLPESVLTLMMATRLVPSETIYIIYPLFHSFQYLHAFVCPVVYVFTNKKLMKAIRSRHFIF